MQNVRSKEILISQRTMRCRIEMIIVAKESPHTIRTITIIHPCIAHTTRKNYQKISKSHFYLIT